MLSFHELQERLQLRSDMLSTHGRPVEGRVRHQRLDDAAPGSSLRFGYPRRRALDDQPAGARADDHARPPFIERPRHDEASFAIDAARAPQTIAHPRHERVARRVITRNDNDPVAAARSDQILS